MHSGFKIEEEIRETYKNMKARKVAVRYATLKVLKETEEVKMDVKYEKSEDQKKDWEHLMSKIKDDEGCFIILDFEVETRSGSTKDQLFFITWSPDSSNINSKTLIASAHFGVVDALNVKDSCVMIQANDRDEVDFDELLKKGKK